MEAYKNSLRMFWNPENHSIVRMEQSVDWEIADGLAWRTAMLDVSSVDVAKIWAGNINKGAAFIYNHALGHLGTHRGHVHPFHFDPLAGFMATESGVFHILGTVNLNKNPELFDINNSLDKLIDDPKKKFGNISQTYKQKIWDLVT